MLRVDLIHRTLNKLHELLLVLLLHLESQHGKRFAHFGLDAKKNNSASLIHKSCNSFRQVFLLILNLDVLLDFGEGLEVKEYLLGALEKLSVPEDSFAA